MNFDQWQHEVDYATYDPDDNKIRIYSGHVVRELYDALKAAGFNRAYKQGCFYATWTPAREDIALWLCGEIVDEDTSILDRAEDRAGRFAGYSGNAGTRAQQASQASHDAVAYIPLGQPILVGHHSEKAHRRAIERAQNQASKAVEEYDRSGYWKQRAAGVLRYASRVFFPAAIQRKIKRLESDRRKRSKPPSQNDIEWFRHRIIRDEWELKGWDTDLSQEQENELTTRTEAWLEQDKVTRDRWIKHRTGQIEYWKALLQGEHGVDLDAQWPLEKGHWVKRNSWDGPIWAQVVRVNKNREKRISSVSINRDTMTSHYYTHKWPYEELKAWQEEKPV